ncbi:hypothetical protein JST97_19625 [bacterium]|nr:hypothetical protein [bacterium]
MIRRWRGETLLELTAAIGLLSLVLFALLTVVPGSFFTMPKAEHQLAANQRAEEVLNQMAAGPFSALTPGTRPLEPVTLDDGTVVSGSLEIQKGEPPLSDVLRKLTITLQWRDRQRRQVLVRHRRLSRLQR